MDCVCTGSELIARWFDRTWRPPLVDVTKLFIPIWFCVVALNLWIGVKAGHSLKEELPIFVLIFAIAAEYRRVLVVAILRLIAEIAGLKLST
jgi:hypothetical protein